MSRKKFNIIIPVGMRPRPKIHEETAGEILADYFKNDIYFIRPSHHSSPDISVEDARWEIKSPVGTSANNIQKNMREAGNQSPNVVIDLRRMKLHQTRALGYVKVFANRSRKVKHVLVITKTGQVLTIK